MSANKIDPQFQAILEGFKPGHRVEVTGEGKFKNISKGKGTKLDDLSTRIKTFVEENESLTYMQAREITGKISDRIDSLDKRITGLRGFLLLITGRKGKVNESIEKLGQLLLDVDIIAREKNRAQRAPKKRVVTKEGTTPTAKKTATVKVPSKKQAAVSPKAKGQGAAAKKTIKAVEGKVTPPKNPAVSAKKLTPPKEPAVSAKKLTPPKEPAVSAKKLTPPKEPAVSAKKLTPPVLKTVGVPVPPLPPGAPGAPPPPPPPPGMMMAQKLLKSEPEPLQFSRTKYDELGRAEVEKQIGQIQTYLKELRTAFTPFDNVVKGYHVLEEGRKTQRAELKEAQKTLDDQEAVARSLQEGAAKGEVVILTTVSKKATNKQNIPIYPDAHLEQINTQLKALTLQERRAHQLPVSLGDGFSNSVMSASVQGNIAILTPQVTKLKQSVETVKTRISAIEKQKIEGKEKLANVVMLHESVKKRIGDWQRALKQREKFLSGEVSAKGAPSAQKTEEVDTVLQTFKDNIPAADELCTLFGAGNAANPVKMGMGKKEPDPFAQGLTSAIPLEEESSVVESTKEIPSTPTFRGPPPPPPPPGKMGLVRTLISGEPTAPAFERIEVSDLSPTQLQGQITTIEKYLSDYRSVSKSLRDAVKKYQELEEGLVGPKGQLADAQKTLQQQKAALASLEQGKKDKSVVTLVTTAEKAKTTWAIPIYPDEQWKGVNAQLEKLTPSQRTKYGFQKTLGEGFKSSVMIAAVKRNIAGLEKDVRTSKAEISRPQKAQSVLEAKKLEGKERFADVLKLHGEMQKKIEGWERALKLRRESVQETVAAPKAPVPAEVAVPVDATMEKLRESIPAADELCTLFKGGMGAIATLGPLKSGKTDELAKRLTA